MRILSIRLLRRIITWRNKVAAREVQRGIRTLDYAWPEWRGKVLRDTVKTASFRDSIAGQIMQQAPDQARSWFRMKTDVWMKRRAMLAFSGRAGRRRDRIWRGVLSPA